MPELSPVKWILHLDITPGHEELEIQKYMAKKPITKIDRPPYSRDLVLISENFGYS